MGFTFSVSASDFASNRTNERVSITLNGILQHLDYGAALIDGVIMIDSEDLSEIIGADYVANYDSNNVNMELRGMFFRGQVGERQAILYRTPQELSVAPILIDGRIWVPMRDIIETFNIGIEWDSDLRLVRLDTGLPNYSFLAAIDANLAAERIQGETIEYEDAIELMNERSAAIIEMQENMIFLEREQRALNEQFDDHMENVRETRNNENSPLEVELFRARRQLNNRFRTLELNEIMIIDSNEIQLRNLLANQERIRLDILMLEEQIAFEKEQLILAELRHSLGLESDAEIRSTRSSIERNNINLENLIISQRENRLAQNLLLGFPADALITIIGYEPIGYAELNLQENLRHQLQNAPNIRMRAIDLDNVWYIQHSYWVMLDEDFHEEDYVFTERNRERTQEPNIVIEMRNNVNSAERALEDAQDAMERNIRSTYTNLLQLEENRNAAHIDLDNAVQDYRDAITRYLAGMATYFEVNRARLGIVSAEIALARIIINFDMTYFQFNNPHLN